MWEKVERTKSKELNMPDAKPLGLGAPPIKPDAKPKTPAKPSDPSKPPYPYQMSESENRDYRWRWKEASISGGNMEDDELVEAVRYALEILRSNGIDDPLAFICEVEALSKREAARARRSYRMSFFLGLGK
jgi:hypothetical protein